MKKYILILVLLLSGAVSCTQRYELSLPLALNRVALTLPSGENSSYVLVYSEGAWTASLNESAPWVKLSRTEGSGNSQITVSVEPNSGFLRSVTLTVTNAHGSKDMLISQQGDADDD